MTLHCITWHDTTQAITSHQMTWPSHDLTPQQTSRHQNTSLQSTKHHHHGTAEGSFTAKKWFGHRAGRSPCAHSIDKFFLCYIVRFLLETSAPGLSGHIYVRWYIPNQKTTPSYCSIHRVVFTIKVGSGSSMMSTTTPTSPSDGKPWSPFEQTRYKIDEVSEACDSSWLVLVNQPQPPPPHT